MFIKIIDEKNIVDQNIPIVIIGSSAGIDPIFIIIINDDR